MTDTSTDLIQLAAQQKALQTELARIQSDLKTLQAKKVARLEDSLYSQALYPHYWKVAQDMAKSQAIPKAYIGKPHDIMTAIAMGYRLGFPIEIALQNIAVVNGRPALWGDGLLALALSHPMCEDIIEEPIYTKGLVTGYRCTVKRKNQEPHAQTFTLEDAKQAQLVGRNTWASYPTRMLQMRARNLAIRDKFADILQGISTAEIEREDYRLIEGEVVKPTRTEQLVQTLSTGGKADENTNQTHSHTETVSTTKTDSQNLYSQSVDSAGMQAADLSRPTATPKPAEPAQILKIQELFQAKGLNEKRQASALQVNGATDFETLTDMGATKLIEQLTKLKDKAS